MYLLLVFIGAGTLSLWSYLRFRRGADRAAQRRVASFSIKSGMRHLPVMLAVGAAFWYSIAVAVLAAFLPEGLQAFAIPVVILLVFTAVVLMVVWTYRPPRRLLPTWYQAELDQAPKPPGRKRSRAFTAGMLWLAMAFLGGAYAAYRVEAPSYLWAAAGVVGGAFFVGSVVGG